MTTDTIAAFFVYGTLKTGQCRERCWPRRPRNVWRAWTLGELFDTGPYPALFPGNDAVGGQVWVFDEEDMDTVTAVLDEVEEYQPGREATNLYNRAVIDCYSEHNDLVRAYTYFYGREHERHIFRRMVPAYSAAERRLALWPAGVDW